MARIIWGIVWTVTGMLCGIMRAEDKPFSGPQPGEQITAFDVLQVSTTDDVKEVTIAGDKSSGPQLLVFAHKINEPALGFMITLEWYANKFEQLQDHYILLTDDRTATERMVRRWWQRPFFANAAMCISVDGAEGPGSYGLNRNVDMTVLIVDGRQVKANFAILGATDADAPEILAKVAEFMGQPAPSMEELRAELRAERARRRSEQLTQRPVYKIAPNPDLGRLMLRLLYREGNTEAYINEAAEEMLAWAGDDPQKKSDLVAYCRAVLDGEFEFSVDAERALKKLAGRDGS